jgi:hypothetical protein
LVFPLFGYAARRFQGHALAYSPVANALIALDWAQRVTIPIFKHPDLGRSGTAIVGEEPDQYRQLELSAELRVETEIFLLAPETFRRLRFPPVRRCIAALEGERAAKCHRHVVGEGGRCPLHPNAPVKEVVPQLVDAGTESGSSATVDADDVSTLADPYDTPYGGPIAAGLRLREIVGHVAAEFYSAQVKELEGELGRKQVRRFHALEVLLGTALDERGDREAWPLELDEEQAWSFFDRLNRLERDALLTAATSWTGLIETRFGLGPEKTLSKGNAGKLKSELLDRLEEYGENFGVKYGWREPATDGRNGK